MFGRLQLFIVAVLTTGTLFAVEPLVKDTVFVAFDTETTGFSPKNDRLIEIGAVKFRGNGEVLAATNWLINPGMPVPFYATEVNGITTEMVTNAPVFTTVWPAFAAFFQNSILLAHNATFDAGFLRAELDRAGIATPALPVGDTLPLFRTWFPQAKSHALEPLAVYLGVHGETHHRGGADSLRLIEIFSAGIKHRPDMKLQQLERDAGGFESLAGGKH